HLLLHAGVLPGWTLGDLVRRARAAEALIAGPERAAFLSGGDEPRFAEPRQTVAALTRLRVVRPDGRMLPDFDGTPADAPPGARPWWGLAEKSLPPIVCGHWSRAGVVLGDNVLALDSGCVWGGQLSALRLGDKKLVQIDCAEGRRE